MSLQQRRGIDIPWPAVAISSVFAALGGWLGLWWVTAFFGGMVVLLFALDLAVRMGWLKHPDARWAEVEGTRKRAHVINPAPQPMAPRVAPPLDDERQARVHSIVTTLARHGIFAPEVPDPALLYAGIADNDLAGDVADVLACLEEVPAYHPDVDPARWMENLSQHPAQSEQDVAWQLADLVRLVDGAHPIVPGKVSLQADGLCTATFTIDARPVTVTWRGHPKYISTHLHVAIARALVEAGTGQRLAWLWDDAGPWISRLYDGAAETLNAALDPDESSPYRWEWIDEAEPFAAGEAATA